jgi:peptidoglycan/xylan/chitin deacetylase (PgdA/CDA1 family)
VARGALALTFDNLGEASAQRRGAWPADAPPGTHPSVTEALPRLLDALDEHALRATFFVEAVNCERYPEAVRGIAARGHEVGHHSWSHETWGELGAEEEAALLRRGLDAFAALGVEIAGFRPPGGELTQRTPRLLRAAGLRWCSPEGDDAQVADGLAVVPFRWPLVDAFHLMEDFAALRARLGVARSLEAELDATLDGLARDGGATALVLHPFLAVDEAVLAEHRRLLAAISARVRAGEITAGPGRPIADALLRRSA